MRKVRTGCAIRSQYGVYLIEFLVALAVGITIAQILIDSISETHRFSTDGQDQLLAVSIAEEVIDAGRALGYAQLQTLMPSSPHTLPINTGDGTVDLAFPRFLVMDLQHLVWTKQAVGNKFVGTVSESMSYSNSYPDMIQLSVTVNWSDSGSMSRTYKLYTLVSKYGIQN